nr:hypothetical protein [Tanacetum cinerariifolium]
MDMTIDQQVALDEALIPQASRLRIRKRNFRLKSNISSKESTLQLALRLSKVISGSDSLGLYHKRNVDFAYLLDGQMFTTIKLVWRHQNTQKFSAMLPIELTNEDIGNYEAYKEYYAVATGATPPKTKASVQKTKCSFNTTVTPPTAATGTRLLTSAKGKQPAKASKAMSLTVLFEVAMTEAKQLKLATKRSMQQTHISQARGSGADVGTGIIPGVLMYLLKSLMKKFLGNQVMKKMMMMLMKEAMIKMMMMLKSMMMIKMMIITMMIMMIYMKGMMMTIKMKEDVPASQNTVKAEGMLSMADNGEVVNEPQLLDSHEDLTRDSKATKTRIHISKEVLDFFNQVQKPGYRFPWGTGFTVDDKFWQCLVAKDANRKGWLNDPSSSVSSQFVTSMLNPTPDAGIDSIFETTSQVDVQAPTTVAPLPFFAPTLTPSTIATISIVPQASTPPTTAPSTLLQDLPNFGLLFGFDHRLKTLESNFSEFIQTNQFAGVISSIPGILQRYVDQ